MAARRCARTQTVALTFDDAPDATNTARVLDALKNAGVKATFFVNTHNQLDVANSATGQVRGAPQDMWRYM